jgi:uncharacterized protein YjbI with pentapeptide repeats
MTAETVTQENLAAIDWETDIFKFCVFEKFYVEGKTIDSVFVSCSFGKVEWYWGLFNMCILIGCQFTNCVFRGSSFPGCKFVECTFINCQFVKDNLNSDCDFEGATCYGCSFQGVEGFNASIVG